MTGVDLIKYDTARKALAEAHRVDEVKSIRDKAVAMQVYARQAKDGELIALATEIRKRAERRLGELIEEQRKTGRLAKGGQPHQRERKSTGSRKDPVAPTLADQGVDKHLADRARKAAAMPAEKFEAHVAKAVKVAVAATEGDREVVKAARAQQLAEKRARRAERERELGAKQLALPTKKHGIVVVDDGWKDDAWSEKTGVDRNPDYTVHDSNNAEQIVAATADIFQAVCAVDCILFMWTTIQHLAIAIAVMRLRGFEYKSHYIWDKGKPGMGRWVASHHEVLLIGTRG